MPYDSHYSQKHINPLESIYKMPHLSVPYQDMNKMIVHARQSVNPYDEYDGNHPDGYDRKMKKKNNKMIPLKSKRDQLSSINDFYEKQSNSIEDMSAKGKYTGR